MTKCDYCWNRGIYYSLDSNKHLCEDHKFKSQYNLIACSCDMKFENIGDGDKILQLAKEKLKALKFDDNKTKWNYIYYPTFEKLCKVMVKGSKKYGFENWKKPKKSEQMFQNAIMRHWVLIQSGEWIDKESGMPHIIHIIANCMMEDYHHD